jgi:hypothetical protein
MTTPDTISDVRLSRLYEKAESALTLGELMTIYPADFLKIVDELRELREVVSDDGR